MKVLGIEAYTDSGAAIVEDGRILAAVNEERLCRMKLVKGFPRLAIREVLALARTDIHELDAVLVSTRNNLFVDGHQRFDGWFQYTPKGAAGLLKRSGYRLSAYADQLPFLEMGYYTLLAPTFWQRRRKIRGILRSELGVRCPIHFVDHHLAHIAAAYFTSGFDDALVVSLDGGGDGKSSLVYAARDGQLQLLNEVSAFNSLGNYYAYVTHICGFKAMKHEGKITGLAAHGQPRYLPILREFIDEAAGTFKNRGGVAFKAAIDALEKRLPAGWKREDLAASIQAHFEALARRYVGHWARQTGLRDVALAGGVVANVRVNEEIHRLPEIDRLFIHPGMGDGGLAVGAALAACIPGTLAKTMPRAAEPLRDVYLGPDLTNQEILEVFGRHELVPERLSGPLEEKIADLLAQGHVVARADGRMEYGPRALGNRSIMYQPNDRDVNDWLNKNLHRTEFMPFAPSVLHEERERCFEEIEGAEHPAEFMTITFHCTPWMRENMQGTVHLDNTARPHLVRKDRNPGYYGIIEAFHRRTGLPGIINTSFNMHEEPIVCTAEDCVRGFLDGNLDYLAIGRHLVRHPAKPTRALKPAVRAGIVAA
jgi:carbamoyltransferase